MQVSKKITLLIINLLLMFLLSACTITKEPGKVTLQTAPADQLQQHAERPTTGSVAKRFQEPAPEGKTTAGSAIELTEKYAQLSKEVVVLEQKNQELINENNRLKDQLASYESQLQQAQKELEQANDLLFETRIELNNWKSDILGFRDEMRSAETAQLQALLKILNTLGGEVKPDSTQTTGSPEASSGEPNQPQTQQISTSGDSNE